MCEKKELNDLLEKMEARKFEEYELKSDTFVLQYKKNRLKDYRNAKVGCMLTGTDLAKFERVLNSALDRYFEARSKLPGYSQASNNKEIVEMYMYLKEQSLKTDRLKTAEYELVVEKFNLFDIQMAHKFLEEFVYMTSDIGIIKQMLIVAMGHYNRICIGDPSKIEYAQEVARKTIGRLSSESHLPLDIIQEVREVLEVHLKRAGGKEYFINLENSLSPIEGAETEEEVEDDDEGSATHKSNLFGDEEV